MAPTFPWLRMLFLVGAAVVLSTTAIRIELLNRIAQCLPNRELRDDGTPVKWRQSLLTSPERWRNMRGPQENGAPATRPLSADERAQMESDIKRAIANNELRDLVATWGLGQYLLVPLTVIVALSLLVDRRQRAYVHGAALMACGIAVFAAALAWGRGYLSSLGL